jgi:hypothetical protein
MRRIGEAKSKLLPWNGKFKQAICYGRRREVERKDKEFSIRGNSKARLFEFPLSTLHVARNAINFSH